MSINITENAGRDEPFAVEIDEFPTQVSLVKNNSPMEIAPFFLFLLVFLYFTVNAIAPARTLVILLVAGVAMLILSFLLIRRSERRDIMTFGKSGVSVTEAGLFTDHHWQAPYEDFDSVFMRRCQAGAGRKQTIYQMVELKHPDPAKTLPLFVHQTNVVPTERWKSYAELFDLPARRDGTGQED